MRIFSEPEVPKTIFWFISVTVEYPDKSIYDFTPPAVPPPAAILRNPASDVPTALPSDQIWQFADPAPEADGRTVLYGVTPPVIELSMKIAEFEAVAVTCKRVCGFVVPTPT